MTRRLEFGKADINYLANLCHNCGACLHACQYAPPHEFGVNVPQAMAKVRLETYTEYAWPPSLGALYKRNGLTLSVALAAGLALFLMLAAATNGSLWGVVDGELLRHLPARPDGEPVRADLPVRVAGAGRRRAPLLAAGRAGPASGAAALGEAAHDVLRLKYLDGGHGKGCNEEDDAFTQARRRFHHFTFYGFLLCFAATSVATLYHYLLGWPAPYGYDHPAQAAGHRRRHRRSSSAPQGCCGSTCAAIRCTTTSRSARWTAASSRCCSSRRPAVSC